MGKQFTNINKKLQIVSIVLLIVLVFVLSFSFFHPGVKGSVARPLPKVVYIDNERKVINTESSEPLKALTENGIEVFAEDKISTELILDPVTTGAVGEKITIKRAPVVHVEADGKKLDFRSWLKTIGEVLNQNKFPLGHKDIVSPSTSTLVSNGAYVAVTRINEEDIELFEPIDFNTKTTTSSSVGFGKSSVIQAGKKGKMKKVYHITYKNGVEVSRVLKSTAVVEPKQDKIVARGSITGRANFGYYSGMVTSFYKGMKGKHLLVTNLANGKSVTVEIIGSGPFNGPLMDMGTEPFKAIGGTISGGYIPKVSVVLLD